MKPGALVVPVQIGGPSHRLTRPCQKLTAHRCLASFCPFLTVLKIPHGDTKGVRSTLRLGPFVMCCSSGWGTPTMGRHFAHAASLMLTLSEPTAGFVFNDHHCSSTTRSSLQIVVTQIVSYTCSEPGEPLRCVPQRGDFLPKVLIDGHCEARKGRPPVQKLAKIRSRRLKNNQQSASIQLVVPSG